MNKLLILLIYRRFTVLLKSITDSSLLSLGDEGGWLLSDLSPLAPLFLFFF